MNFLCQLFLSCLSFTLLASPEEVITVIPDKYLFFMDVYMKASSNVDKVSYHDFLKTTAIKDLPTSNIIDISLHDNTVIKEIFNPAQMENTSAAVLNGKVKSMVVAICDENFNTIDTSLFEFDKSGNLTKLGKIGNKDFSLQREWNIDNPDNILQKALEVYDNTQTVEGFCKCEYDSDYRLVKRTDKDRTITYEYDSEGRLVRIIDGDRTVKYEYDSDGKLLRGIDGDRTIAYEYDSMDRANDIIARVDGDERVLYHYGPHNRLNLLIKKDEYLHYSFGYDSKGRLNVVKSNLSAQVSGIEVDMSRSKTYEYDPLDRLVCYRDMTKANYTIDEEDSSGVDYYTVTYEFDSHDNKINTVVASNADPNMNYVTDSTYEYDSYGNWITHTYHKVIVPPQGAAEIIDLTIIRIIKYYE